MTELCFGRNPTRQMTLAARRDPRQRHQTGFFTAGAAPPPSVLHAAARHAQAEDLVKRGLALSDQDNAVHPSSPVPEFHQQNATTEDAGTASERTQQTSGQNPMTPIHPAGALRMASPKPRPRPRGLEALEERWRAPAEPDFLLPNAWRRQSYRTTSTRDRAAS